MTSRRNFQSDVIPAVFSASRSLLAEGFVALPCRTMQKAKLLLNKKLGGLLANISM
jgi:hypothetical protein